MLELVKYILFLSSILDYNDAGLIENYAGLKQILEKMGVTPESVNHLFELLELDKSLNHRFSKSNDSLPVRCFSLAERAKLGPKVCSLISHLEKLGVLDLELREMVIAQLVQLNAEEINGSEVKFVTLIMMARRFGLKNVKLEFSADK